ncbi:MULTISPECIES: hypothetical protein [Burkholderia]|nr:MULTISPECIES: hypothetical protein [Burkholderia]
MTTVRVREARTRFGMNSMLAYQVSLRGNAKLIGAVGDGWPRT